MSATLRSADLNYICSHLHINHCISNPCPSFDTEVSMVFFSLSGSSSLPCVKMSILCVKISRCICGNKWNCPTLLFLAAGHFCPNQRMLYILVLKKQKEKVLLLSWRYCCKLCKIVGGRCFIYSVLQARQLRTEVSVTRYCRLNLFIWLKNSPKQRTS